MEVKLSRAETFITDNPDMALKVLDSLDVEELSTRRLQARYALLYSIALDKNYVDVKDDSIIAPAVRYYARHGSADEKLNSIRREYIMTYKSQFNTLGELCETYIKSADYKDSHKMVYDKVKSMVKQISGDESGQRSLEDMIDRSLDNIMKHFREDFPSYSEVDYRFVSYMIVGFDATTLCMILGLPSKDAVYMKKMRIKKKIQKCTSLYKDFYLEMLG